jgi:hypothetical protein
VAVGGKGVAVARGGLVAVGGGGGVGGMGVADGRGVGTEVGGSARRGVGVLRGCSEVSVDSSLLSGGACTGTWPGAEGSSTSTGSPGSRLASTDGSFGPA